MAQKKKYRLPFEILYENKDVIVIDKPAGLLATHTKLPSRRLRETQLTAENLLNDFVRKGQSKSREKVWLVHRLDRDTCGVMMFAKNPEVADYFRSDWNSLTKKTYRAWVEGIVDEPSGVFESFLLEDTDGYKVRSVKNGGKFATTQWKVVRRDTRRKETLVEINLKSGRKNQIRVHFSENGHPVVGDVKYGAKKASRMFLRSVSLEFRLPDGEAVCVNASSCFSGGLRHN